MAPLVSSTEIFAPVLAGGDPAVKLSLESVNAVVDIIGTSVTAIAIIIGGFWAYLNSRKDGLIVLGLRCSWLDSGGW